MNEKWSITKSMKAWGDLQHLSEYGHWRDGYPNWAEQIAKSMGLPTSSLPHILMVAYEKIAETFINEYIKAGRKKK